MAKSATAVKKEETKAPVEEKPKLSLAPVEAPDHAGSIALTKYDAKHVAEFGNKFMISLVAAAGAEEEAQKMLAAAGEAKQFLSFEMTKAVFDLSKQHEEGKDAVDVYAVFGTAKDVEKLNTRVLLHMGVLKREIAEDDTIQYVWTDENIKALYHYTKELKEKQPDEYTRRFNNRKRLNMRLNEAYRATAILRDSGLTTEDLYYSEAEDGSLVPTIRNAPKEIGGDEKTIQMNSRKPVKGATLSPTMASLVALANKKHKAEPKAERLDKGEKHDGEVAMGMNDEAFGRIINTLRNAINSQEGNFTDEMKKQLKSLHQFLAPFA